MSIDEDSRRVLKEREVESTKRTKNKPSAAASNSKGTQAKSAVDAHGAKAAGKGAAALFVVGGVPRVDLLPPEVRDQAAVRIIRRRAVLAIVGAVAVLGI